MKKGDTKLTFSVMFHPEPEGGFTASVPSLPGCITYGKTLSEAKAMAREAIEGYLASVRSHGRHAHVPSDQDIFFGTVTLGTTSAHA